MKKIIEELKLKNNAVILSHYYQNPEIQNVADYVGDSLYLAKKSKEISESTIIFCGVKFMAETAKILAPDKKVINPEPKGICPMANMISPEKLKIFKRKNPEFKVVSYVNSSSEIKALSDFCCTSANAGNVLDKINGNLLFVPDKNLGQYVSILKNRKDVSLWDGFCYVHNSLSIEDVKKLKADTGYETFIAHPECKKEVLDMADFIGSTGQMINYIKESSKSDFIIGTEIGIKYTLEREFPDKNFAFFEKKLICENMKKIDLKNIIEALNGNVEEVIVDEKISWQARIALENMLK